MAPLHRLLQRQLKRYFGDQPPTPQTWRPFLAAISDAYEDFDTSRELLQRSLVLSTQELHQANAEMRAVFEAIPDLLFRLDADGTILDFKAGSSNDLMLPRDAYRHKRIQNIPLRPQAELFQQALHQAQSSHGRVGLEYSLPLRGQEFFYEARLVPLPENQIVALIRNITERKRAEADLEAVHLQLLETSRQAGMNEVATSVLHNVGNVLNSVNVSSSLLLNRIRHSRVADLGKAASLLRQHAQDLPQFLTQDPQGAKLLRFLEVLAERLSREQQELTGELKLLGGNVEHINEIIAMQQSYARVSGLREQVLLPQLCDDALRMTASSREKHHIRLVREFTRMPPLFLEKHKVLQILVNLLRNADHACQESSRLDKQIILNIQVEKQCVRVAVADNGIGIPPENLTRIFNHGFTTRKNGHGFGLHSSALTAREIGGSLIAQSPGAGQGATFVLELPFQAA